MSGGQLKQFVKSQKLLAVVNN